MAAPSIFTDKEDGDLGVTRLVSSRGGVAAVGDAGRGPEVLLLSLQGSSTKGRTVCVCVSVQPGLPLPEEGYTPAILTGIARFGNGAGRAEVQFDIPTASAFDPDPMFGPNRPAYTAQPGVAFTVPAGNFQLYARDDSLIIPKAGMGPISLVGGSLVSAFVTRGRLPSVGSSVFRKTTFFSWWDTSGPDPYSMPGLARNQTSARSSVPPFAASYIVMRYARVALLVRFGRDSNDIVEEVVIAAGQNLSSRLVPPRAQWVEFVNQSHPAAANHHIGAGQIIYNQDFAAPFGVPSLNPNDPYDYYQQD